MGNLEKKRAGHGWRSTVVAATSLAFFGVSVAAFADTYNFYFSKGKKKPMPVESTVESEATEAPSEVMTDDESAQSSDRADAKAREGRDGNRPIIINNNIHTPNGEENRRFTPPDSSSYKPELDPEDRPPAKPIGAAKTAPAPAGASSVATTVQAPPADTYSHFRFAISGVRWDAKGWNDDIQNVTSGAPGIIATLGIDFTRAVGMNIFGGTVRERIRWGQNNQFESEDMRFMVGAEFQVTPFRLNVGSFDLLELGFILGSSTLGRSELASFVDPKQIHVGTRFNINFGKSFGITTAGRINGRFTMVEAGLVARL